MKLATRLLLAFLALVLFLTGGGLVLSEINLHQMAGDAAQAAEAGVGEVTEADYKLAQKILTEFGERLVRVQAQAAAGELSLLLGDLQFYSYTTIRQNELIRRVATADITAIGGKVAGYLDLYDYKGVAVLHPNPKVEGRNYAEWREKYPDMWKLVERSFVEKEVEGYYSFVDRENRTRQKFTTMIQVTNTPFIVCANVNIDQFFLPVQRQIKATGQELGQQARGSILAAMRRVLLQARISMISGLVLALAGALLAAWLLAQWLAAPIAALRQGVENLGHGDIGREVKIAGSSETRALGRAFNRMQQDLQVYLQTIREETAAREAVESEIKIARSIQESLLPRVFPPFPDRVEFDLHAATLPAKEMAGDFYDFFLLDPDRLILVVADVSGKGIAAALFMAVTRTLLKNICPGAAGPAEALNAANRVLCQDNDTCMFVTLFLGYYRISTGEMVYANAGHNPPLLVHRGGRDELFGALGDPALGIMEDYSFHQAALHMDPGDCLVVYTDGVTEAACPSLELFGEERLREVARRVHQVTAREVCQEVTEVVAAFEEGQQADDLTILVLKRQT
ncbi:MAG: SpoIIE family protein phosphatase [Deltaproteobacteria bacterium]|nr:SpoIIE family protein phosphatase [Deltaproteobacteria bacterium]